jgi:lysophospholipase L1-like esterase
MKETPMPKRPRCLSPVQRIVLAVACALCALLGIGAQAALAGPSPIRYVALGDSYSAASGVVPPDPVAPPQCLRSTLNYPHVIASDIGARLVDVTCGGAKTSDFFTAQYGDVPPQLDALSQNTRLVSMTIGGNDNNVFVDAIVDCGSAGLSTGGQGSPCKDRYGSSFDDTIRNSTYPALVNALTAVHARAPHAEVAILGYPSVMPPSVGCYPRMPVATGDVPYVRDIQATLNDAVSRAAAATNTTYVDFSTVSEGHDACQPLGVRWIEPAVTGTNPVIVHPNALGESQMAAQTINTLQLG